MTKQLTVFRLLIPLHSLGLFDGLQVIDQIDPSNHRITLCARLSGTAASCPGCRTESRRVQGHYWRCLGDLPCFGRPIILRVQVGRFRCVNDACPRRTFGEPLPRIARCRARHTDRLRSSHHAIALALGGNPGAHMATRIGMARRPCCAASASSSRRSRRVSSASMTGAKARATARSSVILSAGAASTCCPGRDPGRVAQGPSIGRDRRPRSGRRLRRGSPPGSAAGHSGRRPVASAAQRQ